MRSNRIRNWLPAWSLLALGTRWGRFGLNLPRFTFSDEALYNPAGFAGVIGTPPPPPRGIPEFVADQA
jgi:hypothetical protein